MTIKDWKRLSLPLSAATMLAALGSAPASAFQIDTGNPDVNLRWDNTVRYNAGWRLENINPHFANAYGSDETERAFDKHDLIINRVDLLTELDYSFMNEHGFRVSASLWHESAYPEHVRSNPLFPSTVPTSYGPSGEYSKFSKRYATGSSGEFLDAFVFGTYYLGPTTLKFRLGQHTVYWGEASFSQADGISHGMAPVDAIKAQQSPGATAKETFLPTNQFSFGWSLTDELAVQGLYTFDWKPVRASPGGTYFSSSDGSGDTARAGSPVCASTRINTCTPYMDPVTPGRDGGAIGLAARWSPSWLEGTMGFYYRKYDERNPWSFIQRDAANNMGLRLSYARDTELFGASLQKNLFGVSTGIDVSYRKGSALQSVQGFMAGSGGTAPATSFVRIPLSETPAYSLAEGARGDTFHVVANGQILLKPTFLYDSGVFMTEVQYQRLQKVTKNPNLHYSEDYACRFGYALVGIAAGARNRTDGCATEDAWSMNVLFMPQWTQPLPGLALSLPISVAYGIRGNSPALGGSYEGSYRWSIGLSGLYRSKYEVALAINDSRQKYKTTTATAASGVPGEQIFSTGWGTTPLQNSHRWLSLRLSTSF